MPQTDPRRLAADLRRRPTLRLGAGPRDEGGRGDPGAALTLARAHEICGPARTVFAAMVAGALERRGEGGPVLWLRAPSAEGGAAPDGLCAFFGPERVALVAPRREADLLWCAEEALRAGAAPLIVAELSAPARLTPVRRLHLAAEAGAEAAAAAGGTPPLALLLTPAEGGSEGVESRWRIAPAPSAACAWARGGRPAWRLERRRARLAPPRIWRAEWAPGAAADGPLTLRPWPADRASEADGALTAPAPDRLRLTA
jgi:protein ImuA